MGALPRQLVRAAHGVRSALALAKFGNFLFPAHGCALIDRRFMLAPTTCNCDNVAGLWPAAKPANSSAQRAFAAFCPLLNLTLGPQFLCTRPAGRVTKANAPCRT